MHVRYVDISPTIVNSFSERGHLSEVRSYVDRSKIVLRFVLDIYDIYESDMKSQATIANVLLVKTTLLQVGVCHG